MATKADKFQVLKAIFAEAKKYGIPQETIRNDIAPVIIGKRLSKANTWELGKVLDHIKVLHGNAPAKPPKKEYESTHAGLLEEVRDLAIERYGHEYAEKLNNFAERFLEPDGFRKMKIAKLKEFKRRLKELNENDPWIRR